MTSDLMPSRERAPGAGQLRISDFEFRIGRSEIRNPKSAIGLALALLSALPGNAASAYDAIVAPIFKARCVECHGEQKQKAKLALHTWEAAARGSDGGPIWVAGKPGESTLLQRMRLPLDDEEHMPPQDHPQPAPEEIALLAHWIERGASQTATLAQLQLPGPLAAAAAQLPTRLAALPTAATHDVWEYDPAAVAKARAPLAARVGELQRRFPGALTYVSRTSTELRFVAVGLGATFGDAELAALAPVAGQIVLLDVSGTAVTERSAASFAAFKNLQTFRASSTAVGDATVAALAALPRLESVSLHSSAVTPASIATLERMPALRKVHLGATAASAAARQTRLPVVEVAIEFPPLPPGGEKAEGGKRE